MKFLFGLILSGGTIGKDEFSWTEDEVAGRIPIMFAETASSEYEDITSLRHIWNNWQMTGRDFYYAYKVAKEYYNTLPVDLCGCDTASGIFHALSDDEKDAAVSLQVGPQTDRINFAGLTEVLTRNLNWNKLTYDSRLGRTQCSIVNLMVYLPNNYKTAFVELVENETFYKYIQFAIEGLLEGDPEGIFDYILGRVGSTWAGAGLVNKPWTPINNLTMVQVCDLIMAIIRDGDYIYGSTFLDLATQNFSGNINLQDVKLSVKAASTGNIELINPVTNIIDDVTMNDGDRILLKDQTNPAENGIYIWDQFHLFRAYDANNNPGGVYEVTSGMFTFVEMGTANATSGWVLSTPNPIELDVTPLTFVQFNGSGGGVPTGNIPTDILYVNLLDLLNTSTLVPGLYKITDRADQGIIVRAVANNKIENYGDGIFLNGDYGSLGFFSGNYSGVAALTGIAVGNKLGVWETTQGSIHYDNYVYIIEYDTLVGSFLPGETVDNVDFSGVIMIDDPHPGAISNMEINSVVFLGPGPYSGTITGATSGATAEIVSVTVRDYKIGETLTGGTSGATGVLHKVDGDILYLKGIVGDFVDNEHITGGTTGLQTDVNGSVTYTFNPAVGDIVVWNGLHYQRIAAGTESLDPTASLLYEVLPKAIANTGYLLETNYISYNLRNDVILKREDNFGNVVPFNNLSTFQFGNSLVNGNKISPKATLTCINQKGKVNGNDVLGSANAIVDNTHFGEIRNNVFAGFADITCSVEQSVKNLKVENCYIAPVENIYLDPTLHYANYRIEPGFSNFVGTMLLDDPGVYDGSTLTLDNMKNYVGIFTLGSIATTFTVNKIKNLVETHDVTLVCGVGRTGTFVPTDIGSAAIDDYVSSNLYSDLIVGRANGGDELVIRRNGNFNQKVRAFMAVPLFDDKNYVHDQPVASVTWTVTHNLQKWPSVSIVNAANEQIYADVVYIDTNSLTITFGAAESGRAFIN